MTTEAPAVVLRTLGCRLNQAESDEISVAFSSRGLEIASSQDSSPEVVVVNTCTVTQEAAKASRQLIRRTAREHPDAKLVVTGCYAVAEPDAVAAIGGVDLVVPNKDKATLAGQVTERFFGEAGWSTVALGPANARVNLKVQTGCDEHCGFCIVPTTRGTLSSGDPRRILSDARMQASLGAKELVLTGVHLGKFGYERGERGGLAELLRRLAGVDGIERIRLSSIEGSQIDEELLRSVADEPRVCRHLHIPLQTGDDGLWRRMGRPGTLHHYLWVTRRARELMPEVAITTDVMVGYPTENEQAFDRTLQVVSEVGFQKLHVFRFSPRPGTRAAGEE